MWLQSEMLERAHHYAERWYSGYATCDEDLLTHATYVVNVFHQYWPLATDERISGVLLSHAPACATPTTRLAVTLVEHFGENGAQMVWEMDRVLRMLRPPINMYILETHLRKLARQDVWSLRAIASYVVVSSRKLPHLKPVRDTLIAAGDPDIKQLLTAHT